MGIPATQYLGAVRGAEIDAMSFQKHDGCVDTDLLFHAQPVPPGFELIGEEHFNHRSNIAPEEYGVKV
jgi:hypothetical protein